MTGNAAQPTIPVKKPDGSVVHMTLAEFKAYKEKASMFASAKSAMTTPAKPVEPKKQEPAKIEPKKWTRDDTKSPLEEKMVKSGTVAPMTSSKREDDVQAVLGKLNFSVAPELQNRLRSLIQLRLKDLRSADETKSALLRVPKDGGLGLTENQAAKIVSLSEDVLSGAKPEV